MTLDRDHRCRIQSTANRLAYRCWRELCESFGVEVPDTNFAHVNSTEAFRAQFLGRTGGEGG